MREVEVGPVPLDRLAALLTPERAGLLRDVADTARSLLAGRTVWNVNATAQGGGVAEMLQTLLSYGRGAGVDTRWVVLDADHRFFSLTKRLHNLLHGDPGDGGPLGAGERKHYVEVLRSNLDDLAGLARPGDIVLLHDPQTAGLAEGLRRLGLHVIWRCHIGCDTPNAESEAGWRFLRPFVEPADAFIFSRAVYPPAWVPPERLCVIPPSIDPFSVKNRSLEPDETLAVLRRAGLLSGSYDGDSLPFFRRDGSSGVVRRHDDLFVEGQPLPDDARLVVQVSRWDRLKDMCGVLRGFAAGVHLLPDDAHLLLVGPEVSGVSDDPEGAEVLAECREVWRSLPAKVRRRAHLVVVPMDDVDENAHIVNAVQRQATTVVQKSLVEGFGLTVTEAMWKGRPVVASAVGGIQDQIVDGRDGVLLPDPHDLRALAEALDRVLGDDALVASLGAAARERVRDQFLGDRHLIQYVDLFANLLA